MALMIGQPWPVGVVKRSLGSPRSMPLVNASSVAADVASIQDAFKIMVCLELTVFRYPKTSCVFDGATYDYIIVGAGTTGSVIANRLAEDNNTSVLLIEAGGDPQIESNFASLMLFLKQSDASWKYATEGDGFTKQCNKPTPDDLAIGKVLGGTSSLSYLLYTSGNYLDYNKWADIVKDDTWKWKNVLPYLKKSQKLNDPVINNSPDSEFYGKDGNVELTAIRYSWRKNYIDAFAQMGNEIVTSVNGNNTLGYTDAIFTIGNNIRQSTANSYLIPLKGKPNFHVLKNTIVTKIIFDAYKNAIGVEAYTNDKRFIIIKARREVILSAGIVNSPKLLMLSGIGPRQHLYKHKIATISDLPVGKNLQDHLSVSVLTNMTKSVAPFRPWNPLQFPATVFVGYTSLNKSSQEPDYQGIHFVNYAQLQMTYCTFTYGYADDICNNMISTDVTSQMMFSIINKQKFKSRGKVLLRSADFRDDPLVYTNYYAEKEDLEDHARIIEDFIKILDTEQFKKIGAEFKDPKLSRCKGLKKGSREYWKCYVKCMVSSQHHYTSTCSMGDVVDSRLRVYGVRRLRVADASVMPFPTSGGTLGPAIMIGEKVSDMIKEDNKCFRPFSR